MALSEITLVLNQILPAARDELFKSIAMVYATPLSGCRFWRSKSGGWELSGERRGILNQGQPPARVAERYWPS
jgi:hypothetical protein